MKTLKRNQKEIIEIRSREKWRVASRGNLDSTWLKKESVKLKTETSQTETLRENIMNTESSIKNCEIIPKV